MTAIRQILFTGRWEEKWWDEDSSGEGDQPVCSSELLLQIQTVTEMWHENDATLSQQNLIEKHVVTVSVFWRDSIFFYSKISTALGECFCSYGAEREEGGGLQTLQCATWRQISLLPLMIDLCGVSGDQTS